MMFLALDYRAVFQGVLCSTHMHIMRVCLNASGDTINAIIAKHINLT